MQHHRAGFAPRQPVDAARFRDRHDWCERENRFWRDPEGAGSVHHRCVLQESTQLTRKSFMLRLGNRDGFAIPTAILVIGILSISIAAGFSLIISERRGVDDQKAQVTAFVLAERGLETFFVKRDSLGFRSIPPAVREGPIRIYFTGGYADVELDRVRPPTGSLSGLYVVRSKGTQTQGAVGTTPVGVRTVAQYASWDMADINVEAGW